MLRPVCLMIFVIVCMGLVFVRINVLAIVVYVWKPAAVYAVHGDRVYSMTA